MRVSGLLLGKGSEVVSIAPEATVTEAVALLGRRGIGALIVSSADQPLVGVLSERDIVRAVAARGASALDERVSDVMTADVFVCRPETTVQELMSLMTERRIRHVPVVSEGALCGLVSIGDVVKSRINELETETIAIQEYVWHGRG